MTRIAFRIAIDLKIKKTFDEKGFAIVSKALSLSGKPRNFKIVY